MLDYENEILLEQFITYNHMSADTRDLCMQLILNSKDLQDSVVPLNENSQRKYKVLSMSLDSLGHIIKFNGIVVNDSENRYIDGTIIRKGNEYSLYTNVYRLNPCIDEEEKDYSVYEKFTINEDSILRETMYKPVIGYFKETIPSFDEIELYSDYLEMIGKKEKSM